MIFLYDDIFTGLTLIFYIGPWPPFPLMELWLCVLEEMIKCSKV